MDYYGGQGREIFFGDRIAKMPLTNERSGRGDGSVEKVDIDTFDTYLCPHSTWKELGQEANAVPWDEARSP